MRKLLPLVLTMTLVLGVILLGFGIIFDPTPAAQTPRNYYSALLYTILGRQSEHNQDWYVQNLLSSNTTQITDQAYWDNKPITTPTTPTFPMVAQVLSASTSNGQKWIEVNLTNQTLYAHEGDQIVHTALISSGKPWTPTVTGEFYIWYKVRSQTMKGGSKETGDYYNLPNVTYVQYFYKGYGFHTAYWHNNFGHPMSHGCINLKEADAKWLYDWAEPIMADGQRTLRVSEGTPSTRVVIHT